MKPKIGNYVLLGLAAVVVIAVVVQFALMVSPTTLGKEANLAFTPSVAVQIVRADGGENRGLTLLEEECRPFLAALEAIAIKAGRQDPPEGDFIWSLARVDQDQAQLICYVEADGRLLLNALYYDTLTPGELTARLQSVWDQYSHRITPLDGDDPGQTADG